MEYTEEILDRATGELLAVSKGDWITITELGQLKGVGRREVRTILRKMGVLVVEGAARHQRHRLAPWVVQRGWGKRIQRRRGFPFDVVGPELRDWVLSRWQETINDLESEATTPSLAARSALYAFNTTRLNKLSVQQAVSWLADHFPRLTQTEVAMVLDVTQQLVAKYLNARRALLNQNRKLRAMDLDERMALRRSSLSARDYEEAEMVPMVARAHYL